MARRSAIVLGSLLVSAALASAAPARANDPATAQVLFDQAKKLMAENRYAEACPKLEESERLDPAGGTQLHLALCRDREGRVATAWALYQDALAQAKRDNRKDRAKIAQERIDALGPRLPRMRVKVPAGDRKLAGFAISRDDLPVGEAQWNEAMPVDPGTRVLRASADGHKIWMAKIEIPNVAQEVVVDVPELEIDPKAAETPAAPPSAPPGSPPAGADKGDEGDGQRTVGLAIAGVGVAGLALGSVFGLIAISKKSDADAQCQAPDFTRCTAAGVAAGDAQKTDATVSTISFIAGAALVAGGAVLYFVAPTGKIAVSPTVGRADAGLSLSARF